MPIPNGDSSAAPPMAFVDSVRIIPQEHRYLSSYAGSFCREGDFHGGAKLTADNHPRRILKSIRCRCQLLAGSVIFDWRFSATLHAGWSASRALAVVLSAANGGMGVYLPTRAPLRPRQDRFNWCCRHCTECRLCNDRPRTKLLTGPRSTSKVGRPIKHIMMRCCIPDIPDCSKSRCILNLMPERSVKSSVNASR